LVKPGQNFKNEVQARYKQADFIQFLVIEANCAKEKYKSNEAMQPSITVSSQYCTYHEQLLNPIQHTLMMSKYQKFAFCLHQNPTKKSASENLAIHTRTI